MAALIDLNHAGREELARVAGIDMKRASELVSYRSEHGPFHSWEDVEHVPGLDASLVERLRTETTIGDAEEADEVEEARGAEDDEEAELIDWDETAGLAAISSLDEEAAIAYEVASNAVDDDELRRMLRSFAEDHRRHVERIEELLHAIVEEVGDEPGEEVGETAGDGGELAQGVLVELVSTFGAIDPMAAVNALIANEQLTNETYANALQFVGLSAALEILVQNAEDERRHLTALIDYRERHLDVDGELDADTPLVT